MTDDLNFDPEKQLEVNYIPTGFTSKPLMRRSFTFEIHQYPHLLNLVSNCLFRNGSVESFSIRDDDNLIALKALSELHPLTSFQGTLTLYSVEGDSIHSFTNTYRIKSFYEFFGKSDSNKLAEWHVELERVTD